MLLLAALAGAATAQYPSRPVRFIVPSAAGGGTDIIARAISLKLSEWLGAQFVVDNRPGAGQMIGIELAAKSQADGYTILMAASTLAINPVMYKKVPYDPVRDFAPITQAATLPNVIVVQGQDVVRGDRMTINTVTREVHMDSTAKGRGTPGRVRGVFYPNQPGGPMAPPPASR